MMVDAIEFKTPQNHIHDAIRFWVENCHGVEDFDAFVRWISTSYRSELATLGGTYIVHAYLDRLRRKTGVDYAAEYDHQLARADLHRINRGE